MHSCGLTEQIVIECCVYIVNVGGFLLSQEWSVVSHHLTLRTSGVSGHGCTLLYTSNKGLSTLLPPLPKPNNHSTVLHLPPGPTPYHGEGGPHILVHVHVDTSSLDCIKRKGKSMRESDLSAGCHCGGGDID